MAGCSGGGTSSLSLRVTAGPVPFDDASAITISGADASHPLTVEASARDDAGVIWTSQAEFTPAADGTVNLATAAPHSGSYPGAHATGPIWSMSAGSEHSVFSTRTAAAMTVTFTASQPGRSSVTARQGRSFRARGVTVTDVESSAGFVGMMFTPSRPAPNGGAALVLGGSEGGLGASVVPAEALASSGHPALALAYFAASGLPPTLTGIPLEYFARALTWLDEQPGVDPRRTTVIGASRGSEAVLLLGADCPDLVHAVIATSPTSFVHGGLPDVTKPAWTWHGRPVPFDSTAPLQAVTPVNPAAAIPVGRIHGPVLLLCGGDDQLWPSCPSSDVIRKQLSASAVTDLREPGAGHLVDFFVPNLPLASTTASNGTETLLTVGGTVQADALGRLAAWPAVLRFLDSIPG